MPTDSLGDVCSHEINSIILFNLVYLVVVANYMQGGMIWNAFVNSKTWTSIALTILSLVRNLFLQMLVIMDFRFWKDERQKLEVRGIRPKFSSTRKGEKNKKQQTKSNKKATTEPCWCSTGPFWKFWQCFKEEKFWMNIFFRKNLFFMRSKSFLHNDRVFLHFFYFNLLQSIQSSSPGGIEMHLLENKKTLARLFCETFWLPQHIFI